MALYPELKCFSHIHLDFKQWLYLFLFYLHGISEID